MRAERGVSLNAYVVQAVMARVGGNEEVGASAPSSAVIRWVTKIIVGLVACQASQTRTGRAARLSDSSLAVLARIAYSSDHLNSWGGLKGLRCGRRNYANLRTH